VRCSESAAVLSSASIDSAVNDETLQSLDSIVSALTDVSTRLVVHLVAVAVARRHITSYHV